MTSNSKIINICFNSNPQRLMVRTAKSYLRCVMEVSNSKPVVALGLLYFAHWMRNIRASLDFPLSCARLYFFPQCAIYAQDCTSPQCPIYPQYCRYYWKKYVTYHISALNSAWYSLHSYFWIATSFDFFLHKHL